MKPATHVIFMRPEPDGLDDRGRDPWYRLRIVKALLRVAGWRIVSWKSLCETSREVPCGVDSTPSAAALAGAINNNEPNAHQRGGASGDTKCVSEMASKAGSGVVPPAGRAVVSGVRRGAGGGTEVGRRRPARARDELKVLTT